MANLTRYKIWCCCESPNCGMETVSDEGEWVKFEDIKEVIPSASHNASSTEICSDGICDYCDTTGRVCQGLGDYSCFKGRKLRASTYK